MKKKTQKQSRINRILCAVLTAVMVLTGSVAALCTQGTEIPAQAAEDLTILVNPVLQEYEKSAEDGTWKVTSDTRFAVEATEENVQNERLREVIALVNAEFCEKGIPSKNPMMMVYVTEGQQTSSDILISLAETGEISEKTDSKEAYRIEISAKGVVVKAASENAVLYALRTIQALMITNNGLPYGTIIDYPDVAERRLHVDCARKFISKDWFIRQIRELSYLKINTLQMHFSENAGFRIECETDPAIVSDEYLKKSEVREILEEARKYGVKVIPSFDSPGHVDQILRAHPEYGQVSNTGSHYASGLDVTNEKAVAYIRSLYKEYMELFGDYCTDFHIGGDEYMEFDRAPFTTQYQSVLDAYAVQKWGAGYCWKDVMANYINELAEFVHSEGFKPRVFNDGLYYGETSSPQKIQMHDYIGIDFWSQMTWNYSIAKLDTFVKRGHKDIYNFNASYFYYVLRSSKPTDGREQHSFDVLNQDQNIYNNWTPGQFQSNTVADDSEYIKGVSMGIWCDVPTVATEDVITEDIASALRAMGSKSWNTDSKNRLAWDGFKFLCDTLGHPAAYEKGSSLPDVGAFGTAGNLGKITLHFVDEEGNPLKDDMVKYGVVDETFALDAAEIYGYRVKEKDNISGTYTKKDQEFTFVYERYCDKNALKAALDKQLKESDHIRETYTGYKEAYDAAKAVYEDKNSDQKKVDDALAALTDAAAKAVKLTSPASYSLYVEAVYPLAEDGYVTGYEAYKAAVEAGKAILADADAGETELKAALDAIQKAKEGLQKAGGSKPTVTATKEVYETNVLGNMLDNNESTKAWFDGNQAAGDEIVFTFASPVQMTSIRVVQPSDVGADQLENASVQIAGTDGVYKTVGSLTSSDNIDKTISFEKAEVKSVKIVLNASKENWYQISEVYFVYEQGQEDNTLRDLIQEAEAMDSTGKLKSAIADMVDALITAQKVYVSGTTDTKASETALREAMEALENAPDEPEPSPDKPSLPQGDMKYNDVKKGDWYYNYVEDVYAKKLMTGLSDDTFGPADTLVRAQFATILYRMEGQPKVAYSDKFKDVPAGQFFTSPVMWAAADDVRVVTGYSNGNFGPNDKITREQMALMMYRYAKYKGYDISERADLGVFPDQDQVSSYARDAVQWCVAKGLISGQEKSGVKMLNPQGDTSRAECATIISRYANLK